MSGIRDIALAKAIGGSGGGGGRNVSYGTNAPDASAGSDGDIYFVGQEVHTNLIADSGYIVRDTETLLSVGSRDFYKINPGEAIAVEAYGTNGYYGPVLISPDLNSVLYTENNTSAQYSSVTIDGVQWYVCGKTFWTSSPATRKNIVAYHSPRYPLPTGTGIADWVAGVLETCHAQIVDTTLLLVQEVYLKHDGVWHQGSNGLDPDWI